MDANQVLEGLRRRQASRWGIGTAASYLKAIEPFYHKTGDWDRLVKDAENRLVYCDEGMVVTQAGNGDGNATVYDVQDVKLADGQTISLAFPSTKKVNKRPSVPGSIMDFECVITSQRKDRDGDVLEPSGAKPDPKMPLLAYHNPLMPIGKFCETTQQSKDALMGRFAIADTPLGHDMATLTEFGALRISHGFLPTVFEEIKAEKSGDFIGWHVKEFDVLEVSLVPIPSNVDAEIYHFDTRKLHDPMVKSWAKAWIKSLKPVQVAVAIDLSKKADACKQMLKAMPAGTKETQDGVYAWQKKGGVRGAKQLARTHAKLGEAGFTQNGHTTHQDDSGNAVGHITSMQHGDGHAFQSKALYGQTPDQHDYSARLTLAAGMKAFMVKAISDLPADAEAPMQNLLSVMVAQQWEYHVLHWLAQGDDFYGDHLLFERLYYATLDGIDQLAETAITYFGTDFVLPDETLSDAADYVDDWGTEGYSSGLSSEGDFEDAINAVYDAVGGVEQCPPGLDSFLGGMLERHRSHVYLLRQANNADMGDEEKAKFVADVKAATWGKKETKQRPTVLPQGTGTGGAVTDQDVAGAKGATKAAYADLRSAVEAHPASQPQVAQVMGHADKTLEQQGQVSQVEWEMHQSLDALEDKTNGGGGDSGTLKTSSDEKVVAYQDAVAKLREQMTSHEMFAPPDNKATDSGDASRPNFFAKLSTAMDTQRVADLYGMSYHAQQEEQTGPKSFKPDGRWNKRWSKAFDVRAEAIAPSRKEYDYVAKHIGCAVKEIYETGTGAGGANVGNFLHAWRIVMRDFELLDVRNLDGETECPPNYDTIQLNSKSQDSFLVDGTSFYVSPDFKFVTTIRPTYEGIHIRLFTSFARADTGKELIERASQISKEQNFLKGEAFALSGDFIPKTDEKWDDLFLPTRTRSPLRRPSTG